MRPEQPWYQETLERHREALLGRGPRGMRIADIAALIGKPLSTAGEFRRWLEANFLDKSAPTGPVRFLDKSAPDGGLSKTPVANAAPIPESQLEAVHTDRIRWDRDGTSHTDLGDYGTITLSESQLSEFIKDYSREWAGTALNQSQMALKHSLPNAHAVSEFVRLHGIRQTSIPFTALEKEGLSPEDAALQVAGSWEKRYLEVAAKERQKGLEKAARKWWDLSGSLKEMFESQYDRQAPQVRPLVLEQKEEDFAVILGISDLHWGKLAYSSDGRPSYNRTLARERLMRLSGELLSKALRYGRPQRILYPFGNDGLHADNAHQTTSSLSVQLGASSDGIWSHWIEEYLDTQVGVILSCAQVAPVTVVVVPGNHDRASTEMLGLALSREFRDHPRVSVLRKPGEPRVYCEYGGNSLCFFHGDGFNGEKNIHRLFVSECRNQGVPLHPNLLAVSGHFHHGREIDLGGLDYLVMPSPSAADDYHKSGGFTGSREGAVAYILDKQQGKVATLLARAS